MGTTKRPGRVKPWLITGLKGTSLTITGALFAFSGIAVAQTRPPQAEEQAADARVEALIAQMSRAEKLQIIHGSPEPAASYQGQAGFIPGVPRLGIPSLRLADGPPGILTRQISAAPPATMALAATFDPRLAEEIGAVIGRNARARGIDIALQPYINIYRDPVFSRAYNTYGEDPLLTGMIGAGLVRGIQHEGVMAQAKHFVAYEGPDDVEIGEQALHEIYLSPFKAVVDAGVSSIMCAYNKVGGVYACGNDRLINDELKKRMGFKGFVTSDWGAVHGAEFLGAGLDLEMPGVTVGPISDLIPAYMIDEDPPKKPGGSPPPPPFFGGARLPEELRSDGTAVAGTMPLMEKVAAGYSATLRQAMQKGTLTEDQIDAAARRVLGQMARFGYLDKAPSHDVVPEPIDRNAPILRRASAASAVLLKNDGVLPLSKAALDQSVLIGPGAAQTFAVVATGEKALGWPARQVGALTALRDGGADIAFAIASDMTGEVIPASSFSGLTQSIDGRKKAVATVENTEARGKSLPKGISVKWTGKLRIPVDGSYDLNLQLIGGSASLKVDGVEVSATESLALHGDVLQAGQDNVIPTPDGLDNVRRRVKLTAGEHDIAIDAASDTSGNALQLRLAWVTPEKRLAERREAIEKARKARYAVVFAWGRGKPDPFALAGDQDRLIDEIASVNANTIVILNTSQAVAMPWLDKVKAVMQMWYTGDEGGWALADLLTGRVSPAGRLPFTWPKRLEDNVGHRSGAGQTRGKPVRYDEGIMVGYRWFDDRGIQPLFPFGYGLSYSRFAYSALRVESSGRNGIDVRFRLRNTGRIAADEVPQVYLGPPDSATDAQFAPRSLVAFDRITLKPGEERDITLHVPADRLRYWSPTRDDWQTARGTRPIWVGASSRDMKLTGQWKE